MGKSKIVDENESREEKGINAKRKRALRNRERLLNHKIKLLENFANGVKMGFSEENWALLARLYSQISVFLSPSERQWLGQIWRETYASEISPVKVDETIGLVRARLVEAPTRQNIY